MDYQTFQTIKNLRPIGKNEVVLDCDIREQGDLGIRRICMAFSFEGYRIEIYKAQGQKSYHAHIKDIPHLTQLSKEQNKCYKELLIKKFIHKVREIIEAPELDYIDFSLCIPDHLVAEENKPHFKYHTIKKQIAVINEGYQNFCDKEVYDLATQEAKEYNPTIQGTGITAQITKRISIIDLAREFGLEVNSKGFAVCPFHPDNNPSLKFYEEQGRFCCFGCNEKGNIIYFYALMKQLKEKQNDND